MPEQPLTTALAIEQMRASAQRILDALAPLSDAQLQQRPSATDWSGAELLAHTAEIMPYWTDQAVEVAMRDQDDLPFGREEADPDRIAAVERGVGRSGAELRQAVQAATDQAARTLTSLPRAAWSRTALHSRRGSMSVETSLRQFLLGHLDSHAQQAESIAAAVRQ